ncbi:MAG TPA: MFS transporter [Candidatus Acidoferrales bacterium]|nr:MFS transporter [Candidatus Acidoferrales bacterium]
MSHETWQLSYLIIFRLMRSFAAGIIILVLPYYVLGYLHYSVYTLGVLYAAATLATAVFALLFGFLTDLWGHKNTLLLVGLLLPIGAILAFASGRLPILFIASILGGFSATGSRAAGSVGGAAQPIQSAVIADLTSLQNRTFWFSLFTFLSGVVSAAGMLSARLFSPRDAFLAAAVVSGAGLVFLLPMKLSMGGGRLNSLQSRKVIGKFSLTAAVNGISQGLVMPFLIPFFVIVYGVPKSRMSVYGFGSELIAAVAMLIAPALERRFGFVKGVAVTRGVGALLLLLLPLTRIFDLALVVYMLTPALRIAAIPAQQTALTAMVHENEMGRALAMNQVARLTTSAGAAGFTGYMFDLSDIGLPFYAYAAITAVSLVLYFRFFGANPELRAE